MGSPSLKLPFDMIIALVQTRYHVDRNPRTLELCIVGTMWRYFNAGSLKPVNLCTVIALNQGLYFWVLLPKVSF